MSLWSGLTAYLLKSETPSVFTFEEIECSLSGQLAANVIVVEFFFCVPVPKAPERDERRRASRLRRNGT